MCSFLKSLVTLCLLDSNILLNTTSYALGQKKRDFPDTEPYIVDVCGSVMHAGHKILSAVTYRIPQNDISVSHVGDVHSKGLSIKTIDKRSLVSF
jgi:hypothetical protein